MVTIPLLLLIVALYLIYQRIRHLRHVEKYKEFYKTPTPFYIPFLGNAYLMLGKGLFNGFQYVMEKFGDPLIFYIPHRSYVTSNPEELKIILNQALDKSKEYDHMKVIFDQSLLISEASVWKRNRRILSKGFKQGILDDFIPTFYEKSCILVDILKKQTFEEVVYLFENYTLDVFCEATLGIKSNILVKNDYKFINAIMNGQDILARRVSNIFKANDFIFSFLPDSKRAQKLAKEISTFLQHIIKTKKNCRENTHDLLFTNCGQPVLDILLDIQEKEKLDDEYICNEMNLFASAAADTSAYSMAYLFCLLAMHPDIQEKVYEEVISVVGEEREIELADIANFKYLDMALMESMRLLPTVPIIGRKAMSDIDLGSKIIPKDTGIIISIIRLHRNEEIYPNPMVFNPERFTPENIKKRHPYSYLPFSLGPRNCIGWKYAQMMMKVSIANVIRNFKIYSKHKSVFDLKFQSFTVMSTTHPLDLKFVPRR